MFSTLGDIMSILGVFSTPGVIMSTLGDAKMHVVGYHEYTGGCSVHQKDTMSTPGDVQYTRGIP